MARHALICFGLIALGLGSLELPNAVAARPQQEYVNKPRARLHRSYLRHIKRAQRKKLPFRMSWEEFKAARKKPCLFCGTKIADVNLMRVDTEGEFAHENMVPACPGCSKMRGNQTLDQWFTQMWRVLKHNEVILYLPEQLGIQRPGDNGGDAKVPKKQLIRERGFGLITKDGDKETL